MAWTNHNTPSMEGERHWRRRKFWHVITWTTLEDTVLNETSQPGKDRQWTIPLVWSGLQNHIGKRHKVGMVTARGWGWGASEKHKVLEFVDPLVWKAEKVPQTDRVVAAPHAYVLNAPSGRLWMANSTLAYFAATKWMKAWKQLSLQPLQRPCKSFKRICGPFKYLSYWFLLAKCSTLHYRLQSKCENLSSLTKSFQQRSVRLFCEKASDGRLRGCMSFQKILGKSSVIQWIKTFCGSWSYLIFQPLY